MHFDYEILRVIWWLLLGVLLIGFAVTDGFDLGIGALFLAIARTESQRRIVLNTVGPVWEGNQIWFVLGGGAIFAAWPMIYAVSFSGFYFAMLLILLALILRPVGFKYRSKLSQVWWRQLWDVCIFFAGFLPALLFGVAIGNVLQGVPFDLDDTLRASYTGTLLDLLNPFALLCGLVSLFMLCMHGSIYLTNKTEGPLESRARLSAYLCGLLFLVLFTLGGVWVAYGIKGYLLSSELIMDAPSNPLHKHMELQLGAWLLNYRHYPVLLLAPVSSYLGVLMALLCLKMRYCKIALCASGLAIAGVIGTVGVSMFPVILPSSIHPDVSLLVWDASSSLITLKIMLIAVVIFIPIILLYTSWVYRVMRGKVTETYINNNQREVY